MMRWLIIIIGIALIIWGGWDCVTGTSIGGDRWGVPSKYTAQQLGPFFYLIAIAKIFGGGYAIFLGIIGKIK